MEPDFEIIAGDCRSVISKLDEETIQTCITSPPYFGLRDYGVDGQVGLEATPDEYVDQLVNLFREVRRVLRKDGTLWLNLGDSYSSGGRGGGAEGSIQSGNVGSVTGEVFNPWKVPGYKPKNLLGIPWKVAFALQSDGWFLRQDIIWHKPNPMPESVTDRCTKAHEYIFLLSKSSKYFFDYKSISEPIVDSTDGIQTRNKRSVWSVTTKGYKGAHFATFPPELIEPCILAGSRAGDIVLDPFNGSGTTGAVALKHMRRYVGIELNTDYIELTKKRLATVLSPLFDSSKLSSETSNA